VDIGAPVVAQRFGHRQGPGDAGPDLVERVEPAPEDPPGPRLDEAVGLLRVPSVDGVRGARAPEEGRVLGPQAPPDRAPDALALRLARHGELVEVGHVALARQNGGRAVRVGQVDAKGPLLFEVGGVERPAETALEQRPQPRPIDALEPVVPANPLAAPHQRARAAVGEELFREVLGRGDRHRRGRRQLCEQRRDLAQPLPHVRGHPGLRDERLVVFGEVDGRHHRALAVDQPARRVQEDDLVGRGRPGERPRRRVGRDDHDLARGRLAERRHHGQVPRPHRGLERLAVHARHPGPLARVALGLEHARREGAGAHPERLERLDEAQVELQVRPAGDVERARGNASRARRRGLEPRLGERLRERRAAAVHHDGAEPDPVQERERRGERVEGTPEQIARDAHHGRLRRALARVVPQVLLDLFSAADVGQKLDDDVAGLAHRGGPS
jgi:hypothetical protein